MKRRKCQKWNALHVVEEREVNIMSFLLFIFRCLLIVGTIALFIIPTLNEDKFKVKKQCFFSLIPLAVFILTLCIVFVPANNVGIKWSATKGTSEKTLDEGITFKSPLDEVYYIPTTVQERTMKNVTVQTKDSQFVTSVVNVKFKVDKKNAFKIYKGYGTIEELKKNIISNYSQKAIEEVVTQYNVIDVLGGSKNEIYKKSTDILNNMLSNEGVTLVQLTIKDMDAGEDIEKAIRDEAVAKKEVETAEQKRLKAQKDAETKVIKAQGEADANAILTKDLTDSVLLDKWIEKWNGELPKVTGNDKMMIDISALTK